MAIEDRADGSRWILYIERKLWLASGQSNMNFRLGSVLGAKEAIEDANYPDILMQ